MVDYINKKDAGHILTVEGSALSSEAIKFSLKQEE